MFLPHQSKHSFTSQPASQCTAFGNERSTFRFLFILFHFIPSFKISFFCSVFSLFHVSHKIYFFSGELNEWVELFLLYSVKIWHFYDFHKFSLADWLHVSFGMIRKDKKVQKATFLYFTACGVAKQTKERKKEKDVDDDDDDDDVHYFGRFDLLRDRKGGHILPG